MTESESEPRIYRYVSRRELAIIILSGALAFIFGVWVGIWSVPTSALAVPMEQYQSHGRTVYEAAYRPVPTSLPWASLGGVVIAVAAAWHVTHTNEEPEETDPVSDPEPVESNGGEEL